MLPKTIPTSHCNAILFLELGLANKECYSYQERILFSSRTPPSPNGQGTLEMNMIHTQIVCLQFWFVIPGNSANSKLEIIFKNTATIIRLWQTANWTSGEWTFGQVELPNNSTGKVSVLIEEMMWLSLLHSRTWHVYDQLSRTTFDHHR